MRRICLLLACAAALRAGMIRGVVVENQTSRPLSYARVTLEEIGGSLGGAGSVTADRHGNFTFASLAAGKYILRASRPGFMPAEYGQKRWNSAGQPIALTAEGDLYLTIPLPRYGGIAGTIMDENYVGWLQGEVLAYRLAEPPVLAGRGRSDERGIYRISGLEPGKYLVRTAPMQSGDLSFMPTFAPEGVTAAQSRPVEVYFEQDATGVDIRPSEGRLFTLSVGTGAPPGVPVALTLASEMGRQTVQGSSARFTGLAPGAYEVYAQTLSGPPQGGYLMTTLDHDASLSVPMTPVYPRQVEVTPRPQGEIKILARRKDFAGVGEEGTLDWANGRATIFPGRWELMLDSVPSGYYVSAFSGGRGPSPRPDGWNEVQGGVLSLIRFTLSTGPGTVSGAVKTAGEPAAGAPVFLEAYDPAARTRLLEPHALRTDLQGQYRFRDVPPGWYRILATFEYRSPDASEMEQDGAQTIQVEQSGSAIVNLDLYGIP